MSELEQLTALVEAISVKIDAIERRVLPVRETYTLEELAELPEAPSLKTLRNNPARQPNRGKEDGFRGGRKAWHRETVERWRQQLSKYPEPRGKPAAIGGAA